MLDDEMTVEQNSFDASEQGIVGIQIRPAGLHHADLFAAIGIDEIRNGAAEEIGLRDEVGVKDGDELTLSRVKTVLERAGVVAVAIGAVDVNDRKTCSGVAFDARAGNLASFVRGVIEDLDIEEPARVIEERDGVDEALDDVAFVEDGELYSNLWPVGDGRWRSRNIFAVSVVLIEQDVAVQAISCEDEENDEVGNHHRKIEGVGVIHAAEGAVGEFVPIMAQRGLLGGE